jgi:four helix bundle suffix protein
MTEGFLPPHGGYASLLSYRKAEIVYDATVYLLDQQIRRLEKDFLKEGGLRERMTHARIIERDKQRKENRKH